MWIIIVILLLVCAFCFWYIKNLSSDNSENGYKISYLQNEIKQLNEELSKNTLDDSDAWPIEEREIILDDESYYTFSDFWNFIDASRYMEIREMDFDDDYKRHNLEYLLAVIAKVKQNESRNFSVRLITDYNYGESSHRPKFGEDYCYNYSSNWLDNLVNESKKYGIKLNIIYEKDGPRSYCMKFYIDDDEWKVFSKTGLDIFEIDDSSILPIYCHTLVHNRKGKIRIKRY